MTGYHQPAEPKWTLSLITLKLRKKKKKIQWSNTKHWLWKTISTASFTITHSIIPLVYFSTPPLPQKNMLLIRPRICVSVRVCVCFYVRLCEWWTDSSEPLFLHTGPALIGFGLGTHIPAVLEIHQPWQVYCTTTLHRLWPTTRTKISLSIRKTFMSGDGGGFEMAAGGKPGCWFKPFASKRDHVQIQWRRGGESYLQIKVLSLLKTVWIMDVAVVTSPTCL